jgi:predicted nucleic acid-binding protein
VAVRDASVLATALTDDSSYGHRFRSRLVGESLAAPDLIYLEVASAWRRQVRLGALRLDRALDEPLLTGDVRLARAAQSLCRIELLE